MGIPCESVNGGGDAVVNEANLADRILTEGDDLMRRVGDLFMSRDLVSIMPECPDFPGLVVSVNVGSVELGEPSAAIHEATRDGGGLGVAVRHDGGRDGRGSFALGEEAVVPLGAAPAVVPAARDEVDVFPQFPADVPAPEVSCLAVEAHLPRIPQTVGPDLGLGIGHGDEGIVFRNGISLSLIFAIDVDAQDGGEPVADVLAGEQGIGGRGHFSIACGNVEVAIGSKRDGRSIVSTAQPGEDDLLTLGIDLKRSLSCDFEAREPCAIG